MVQMLERILKPCFFGFEVKLWQAIYGITVTRASLPDIIVPGTDAARALRLHFCAAAAHVLSKLLLLIQYYRVAVSVLDSFLRCFAHHFRGKGN